MSKPSPLDYLRMLTHARCFACGDDTHFFMEMYPHSDGWPVEGMTELQWLYLHCAVCGYDTALWKLGLPRYEKPIEA